MDGWDLDTAGLHVADFGGVLREKNWRTKRLSTVAGTRPQCPLRNYFLGRRHVLPSIRSRPLVFRLFEPGGNRCDHGGGVHLVPRRSGCLHVDGMSMTPIYLDYNATTPIDPEVA